MELHAARSMAPDEGDEPKSKAWNSGVIVSVRGSVVDIRFDANLPAIRSCSRDRKNGSSSKCSRNKMGTTCAGLP